MTHCVACLSMRRLVSWTAAILVFLALWPTVCGGSEGGPTTCKSALLLPLPWGESADTWGMVVTVLASAATFVLIRRLWPTPKDPT